MENNGQAASFPLRHSLVLAAFLTGLNLATQAAAAPREAVVSVATRPGVTQGYYLIEPEAQARAIAVLFIGGEGELALEPGGPIKGKGNFLMRVRGQLSAAGLILIS